jgi:glycosyltransferase involved in cell wall biosynthesis
MAIQEKSICFISPFMGPLLAKGVSCGTGGAERQFYLFGTELARQGWRVVFIADCPFPNNELPENVSVLHVPFNHLGGSKLSLLVEIPRLFIALIRANTRYCAIKTATHLAGVVSIVKWFNSCRLIMWGQMSHSFDLRIPNEPRWVGRIRRWSICNADYLVAQTPDQVKRVFFAFAKAAFLIPNITVPGVIERESHSLDGYVFWCGNHLQHKRAEIFIELARQMPSVQFIMAMNGNEHQSRYCNIRDAALLLPNFRFLGSVPTNKIDSWFAGASLYVNTSVREGFPNTFLQSWQQGVPVISVNIDPTRDMTSLHLGLCLYHDEEHLKKSYSELAKELSCVVGQMVGDERLLKSYDQTCRDYVARTHSSEVVIEQFVKMIGD